MLAGGEGGTSPETAWMAYEGGRRRQRHEEEDGFLKGKKRGKVA